ncbi:Dynamin family protein [Allomeiothermus silvanus DSM 9946]|uniref:Dynamin family protein n=1 Tax=Allomeiothermus silvanus (strain ATCC 700542 / DSM 9946 / NBRC 106475 / NCIMB 13440 / VI-R2) TaxID=526227 RepID=D7BEX9_ALLS1|nr:dynamin family protein [Allomeiothermus silvanus]ADH63332.1 Dynamin family protein [Allomeiothermus silvanus DSM 9946]
MLDAKTLALAQDVRALLARGLEAISRTAIDPAPIRQALADLEGPFMLVVSGEFNSGKSSILNALLGAELLKEGVTPTTDRINLITYGEQAKLEPQGPDLTLIYLPHALLKDLRMVDTPGTNAILEHHQVLTERFLPRADLILFVTSADRPFTQSEAEFLQLIKAWGKKIVLLVNKIDLLSPSEQREVLEYVRQSALQTLGQSVPVLGLSARRAKQGEKQGSGLADLEAHIRKVLANESAKIKLGSPLGVLLRLVQDARPYLERELAENRKQLATCSELEALLKRHIERTQRDFDGQIALALQVLDEVRERGERWLDETVRLSRILELINASRIQDSFMRDVAQNSNQVLERSVQQSLNWLAKKNQELLEDALALLREAPGMLPARDKGEPSVEQAIHKALERYRPDDEAVVLREEIQLALQQTALASLGGVGLGAGLVLILQSLAADVTGVVAGLVAAILGLSILPRRKDQAKSRLRERLGEVRSSLEAALKQALRLELERSAERFRALYRPTCSGLEATQQRLSQQIQELQALEQEALKLREQLT